MNTANSRRIEAVLLLAALLATPVAQAAPSTAEDAGRRIYREGVLPSGKPLRARLGNGAELSGAAAACVICHRRSGLGGGEGRNTVRPITGRLLFESAHSRGGPPPGRPPPGASGMTGAGGPRHRPERTTNCPV